MFCRKFNLFKTINMFMAVFCFCSVCMNHIGVNVLNTNTATSSINGNDFEYETSDSSLVFKKNGQFNGCLPTDKKLSIKNDNMFFQSNAILVGAKVAAVAAVGGTLVAIVRKGLPDGYQIDNGHLTAEQEAEQEINLINHLGSEMSVVTMVTVGL